MVLLNCTPVDCTGSFALSYLVYSKVYFRVMEEPIKQPVGQLSVLGKKSIILIYQVVSIELIITTLISPALCRLAEPIAFASVFPYLPEMIESFGVGTEDTGKWVGICGGSFSFCQFLTAIVWGRASDRFGRKRAVLAGLFSTMVTSVAFGFSESLPAALVARAVAGLGGGNGGILRTAVAELVPQKELQPRAFSIMPLVWTVGSMLGPAMGGALADPAHKYPAVFGSSSFLLRYPYAAPNLLACLIFVFAMAVDFLFLHETLRTEQNKHDIGLYLGQALIAPCRRRRDKARKRLSSLESDCSWRMELREARNRLIEDPCDSASLEQREAPSQFKEFTWKDVLTSQSQINLLTYGLLATHAVAYDQLLPVLMHLPHLPTMSDESQSLHQTRSLSRWLFFTAGFGMNSKTIGLMIMLNGIVGIILQIVLYPPFVKNFGVLFSLKVSSVAFIFLYLTVPFSVLVPSAKGREACLFAAMIVKTALTMIAWPSSTILITNSASSPALLGTLNGVATSVGAVGCTVGPIVCGAMFTVGLANGVVALPWWTLAAFAALATVPVFWIGSTPTLAERKGADSRPRSSEYRETDFERFDNEVEQRGKTAPSTGTRSC